MESLAIAALVVIVLLIIFNRLEIEPMIRLIGQIVCAVALLIIGVKVVLLVT